jgi:hypothetical protein
MKTKTLLTYGAIAVGAYLAYKYFMKPKAVAAPAAASFTGNEDAQFYQKFTGNEDSKFYNQFTGTIAVNRASKDPKQIVKAVRANLDRKKGF